MNNHCSNCCNNCRGGLCASKIPIFENLNNEVDSRMAYLLTDLMEKYGEITEDNISIKLPLSREDMASFIGVTRETISRKLKKFEDEKLIKIICIVITLPLAVV